MPSRVTGVPQVGGKLAISLFVVTLAAFVAESQLTQYVQTNLGYRKPFFLFYVVHSAFSIIFPIHLAILVTISGHTATSFIQGLSVAITHHLSSANDDRHPSTRFPYRRFFLLIFALAIGVNTPGLLWFAAVSLASLSDVTAIWNTNAFFAYIFTVKLFGLKWESKRLLAVLLATVGVLAVVYGGSKSDTGVAHTESADNIAFPKPSAPLIGDLLTLLASMAYGLYQVLYKKYAALPSDPEIISERVYEQLPDHEGPEERESQAHDAAIEPPFGLHANLLTSFAGLVTFFTFWIAVLILHVLGLEVFSLPPSGSAVVAIAGIAMSGVIFNAGLMILLGVWGPIITSVGNLLTIVLVFLSDMIFGAGLAMLTLWSLFGCSAIVAAFTILAHDTF